MKQLYQQIRIFKALVETVLLVSGSFLRSTVRNVIVDDDLWTFGMLCFTICLGSCEWSQILFYQIDVGMKYWYHMSVYNVAYYSTENLEHRIHKRPENANGHVSLLKW